MKKTRKLAAAVFCGALVIFAMQSQAAAQENLGENKGSGETKLRVGSWELVKIETSAQPFGPWPRQTFDFPIDAREKRGLGWGYDFGLARKVTADLVFKNLKETVIQNNAGVSNAGLQVLVKAAVTGRKAAVNKERVLPGETIVSEENPKNDFTTIKCTFDFKSASGQAANTIRDYSHRQYRIYGGSFYPTGESPFWFHKKGEFECGGADMRPLLKLEEDFTLTYRLMANEWFSSIDVGADATFHFFYKWAGWVYESPGTPISPGDAGGSLDRGGYYDWAQKQDASTLESTLNSKVRLFNSPSVSSETLSSAFADISVIIDAGSDRITHKKWAAGRERKAVLDNLQQKMSAAFSRLNRSQQNSLYADVSMAMARANSGGATGPTVRTNKSAYAPNERIEVEYANPAGHERDFITIARPTDGDQSDVGSATGKVGWRSSTGDQRSGTRSFEGLAEGAYEARYVSWDGGNNRVTARSSFTVGNAPPVTPPVTPPIPPPPPQGANYTDLSGFWLDDSGGGTVYRVRQAGNKVYWSMDATARGEYVNVFHGEIKDNILDGEWLDLPGSPLRPALVAATITFRIESNDRLVKIRSGNFYPAQVWTRQGTGPGSGPNAGVKCAEGKNERTINIEVPANRAWTPTGVALNPCVQVMVEASGSIEAALASDPRGGFYHQVPPAGRGQFHSDKPYQTLTTLSLIGRIGNGPVVPVGSFARWYAGPPYGSGELFLGINDDGLSDNSGAWKVRITTFGAAETSGLTQKVLPSGIEKPKVEEIPDDVTEMPRTPAGRQPPGSTSGGVNNPVRPKVEEIPDDVAQIPTTPGRNPGDRTRSQVEEIPDDEPATPKTPTRNRPADTTTANVPVTPKRQPTPKPRDPNGGFLGNLGKAIGDAIRTNQTGGSQQGTPNPPPVNPPVGQQTGGVWSLVLVTVTPANPPSDSGVTWNYSREGASAQYTLYNGDRASFQWSIPPQQFDSRGFTMSVAAQGSPAANSRIATTIGVSGYGLATSTPVGQQTAAVTAENSPATARTSVTFAPLPDASEIEVRISFHWAITYIYKYRRVQ